MTKIQDEINARVTDEASGDVTFTVNDIITAVGNLNSQKYDGYKSTYSDHFVYASHKYLVVLSMLMNGMLVHGYNADYMLKSTLVSIPKDVRGSLSDSDNYRGIALCSAICKIVYYAIIYKYGSELHTSSLQVAFLLSQTCFGVDFVTIDHIHSWIWSAIRCVDGFTAWHNICLIHI